MNNLEESAAWKQLKDHAKTGAQADLNALFASDRDRASRLRSEAVGLTLDYSKQRLTSETVDLLLQLAVDRGLPDAIEAMFSGAAINASENRPAWHVALRAPADSGYPEDIQAVLAKLAGFVESVRGGQWRGHTGEAITDVVNIGIGGSDLGPRMVCRALAEPNAKPTVYFVANVDPQELDDVLARVNPASTLFVITSKSFTTSETLANARAARAWLLAAGAEKTDIAKHFVAVSTNQAAVAEFGIDTENMFGFWDWVGGRFSLWSAVGLPIALALGMSQFRDLLAGAYAMDEHFRNAPLAQNLPVMLGLVGIWNRNFLNMPGLVVAPYAQRLEFFPGWLQQLEMESNGKSVAADGAPMTVPTVPAIWGSVGTNAQHAFFQMLHQGTDVLPVDFILPLPQNDKGGDRESDSERRDQLIANCLAQAEALMLGKNTEALRADGVDPALFTQRAFAGNRPSNMLVLQRLDAHHLGALLAAYEHKVYTQGVIWGVNSFDQWGVELGKILAGNILADLQNPSASVHDASTSALIKQAQT